MLRGGVELHTAWVSVLTGLGGVWLCHPSPSPVSPSPITAVFRSGFLRRAAQANAIASKSSRSWCMPHRTQAALVTSLRAACSALGGVELRGATALRISRLVHAMALPSRTQAALCTCLNAHHFALGFFVELHKPTGSQISDPDTARLRRTVPGSLIHTPKTGLFRSGLSTHQADLSRLLIGLLSRDRDWLVISSYKRPQAHGSARVA